MLSYLSFHILLALNGLPREKYGPFLPETVRIVF